MFPTFGLVTAPDRYDLHCEPFAIERSAIPAAIHRYADCLAERTREKPYSWFNLYAFGR